MPDFTATRTFLYVAGNIISPVQNTTNETGIYNPHNAAFNGTSGHTHSGSTGDGPLIAIMSPTIRNVVGNAVTLGATDVHISCDHNNVCSVDFPSNPANTFDRIVTVKDYSGNAGLYNINIGFTGGWRCDNQTSISIVEDYGSYTFLLDASETIWSIID